MVVSLAKSIRPRSCYPQFTIEIFKRWHSTHIPVFPPARPFPHYILAPFPGSRTVNVNTSIEPIEQKMSINLRLDQHQINEKYHEIVLDVFIREPLASWTLRKSDAFTKRSVVGTGVSCVESRKREAAVDTDRHYLGADY